MVAAFALLLTYAAGITGQGVTAASNRQVVDPRASQVIAIGAHKELMSLGRRAGGDSVPVVVTYAATGGTITRAGLYTAGAKAGAFHIIATAAGVAETAKVTLARPPGASPTQPTPTTGPIHTPASAPALPPGNVGKMGVPMGLSGLLAAGVDRGPYSMSVDGFNPSTIVSQLANARRKGLTVLMNLAGGSHQNYLSLQEGSMRFDYAKWEAKMRGYDTPEIRAAVAAAVADATIVGSSVMDEPHNISADNSWGPAGTMTKARVDQMCLYVKDIFPTLPVGVAHDHRKFEPEKNYQNCDFIVSQYRISKGTITDFRDGGLAFAKRSGIGIIFGLNVIHGGVPGTDCEKWGNDPHGKLCPMSPEEIQSWGLTLGSAGCALNMWRYERAYFERPENQSALQTVAESLAKLPRKSCTRS